MAFRGIGLLAPAKINLELQVTGKRTDGYHELQTWFQTISLYDRIWLRPACGFGIRVWLRQSRNAEQVPVGRANLVVRAAAAFAKASGYAGGWVIEINKGIPHGAGLGGGSSDAAAVLWGLNQLCQFPLSFGQLWHIAASLGADVPFFLWGGRILATGRGDRLLKAATVPDEAYVILLPQVSVSTAEVFKNLVLTSSEEVGKLTSLSGNGPTLKNDLEGVTFACYPQVAKAKQDLSGVGCAEVMMSGSGSAVFARMASQDAATEARRLLLKQCLYRSEQVLVAGSVQPQSRQPLMESSN